MDPTQPTSRLIDDYFPADYSDCFSRVIAARRRVTPDDFAATAFAGQSGWIAWLMRLRNALMKPFGLKTDGKFADTIRARSENELIFGMSDRHLTFHASLWCGVWQEGRQKIAITTVVRYNNRFGRVYFFFVRPFHRLIMQAMLRRVGKAAM